MENDKLYLDLVEALKQAEKVDTLLDKIYYSDEMTIFFKRPFLTMMAAGAKFLVTNLKIMIMNYVAKVEKKGSK